MKEKYIGYIALGLAPSIISIGFGIAAKASILTIISITSMVYILFGLIAIGTYFIWLGVPFCTTVAWVFQTMERIGRVGENPFEGTANDVPISTIARGIEIDIRQMMDEDHNTIPKQFPEEYNVQM